MVGQLGQIGAYVGALSGLDFLCYLLLGVSVWLGLRFGLMTTLLSTLVTTVILIVAITYSLSYPLIAVDVGPMHLRLASTVTMGLFSIVAMAIGHYLVWYSEPYMPILAGRAWNLLAVLVSLLRLWIIILGVVLVTVIWSPILVDTGLLREYNHDAPRAVAVLTTPTISRSAVGRLAIVTLVTLGRKLGVHWIPQE